MAKFCVYCGRPLKDGEVCNCRNQNNKQPPISNENKLMRTDAADSQTKSDAAAAAAVRYLKNIWKLIVKAFKAPATVLGVFTASGDIKTAFGLISIYSVINSFFVITLFAHINSAITSLIRNFMGGLPYIGEYISKEQFESVLTFPLGKIFFISLITEFGLLCLFAAVLLLVSKAFFNVKTSYNNTLCAASAGGIAAMPFLIIGMLCTLINVKLGLFVVLLGVLLKIFFMFLAFDNIVADRNKGVYIVFISLVVLAICSYIVMRLTFSIYSPDGLSSISSTLDKAKSSTSNGNAYGFFG